MLDSHNQTMTTHPILHVIVCGFNHRTGCKVDYSYPPFPNASSEDADSALPELWTNLASLAIPDTIYFVLPALEERNRAIFGIACYRQIDSSKLTSKGDDVTRSHVQKSVCVLSKIPLYGVLTCKLELITQAYFNENDFSKVEVLKSLYNSLCDIFDYKTLDQQSLYMGIPLSPLLRMFGYRTLELFKLILLERRVIFEVQGKACLLGELIIGLNSLLPRLIEDGLFESALYKGSGLETPDNKTHTSIEPNEYGFPMSVYTKGNLLLPYLSLNCIDSLRSNNIRAYCIGVTNCIFRNNSDLHDVYITVDKTGAANIYYSDSDLEKQLSLNTQDQRFMRTIMNSAEIAKQNPADFTGNDDWIRLKFWSYLCCMFRATQLKSENLPEFNEDFVNAWVVTHSYRTWNRGTYEKLNEFQSIHPASGAVNPKDLFLLIGNRFGQKRLISTISSSTSKFVSEQGNKLQSTFNSWLGRRQEKNNS